MLRHFKMRFNMMFKTVFLAAMIMVSSVLVFQPYDAFAAQIARPDGTATNEGWTIVGAPTVHEAVDESEPNGDTDYVGTDSTGIDAEVTLSDVTDPLSSSDHIIRFTCKAIGNKSPEKVTVALIEGVSIISSSEKSCNRDSYGTIEITLSSGEADSITDYTDLRLRITATSLSDSESVRVTQMEFEVPEFVPPPPETFTHTEEPISVNELITVESPGFFVTNIPKAGSGNIINAVDELSVLIDTGAQKDAAVTLVSLKTTETRSGALTIASYQCIPDKILKITSTETLQNFNMKFYYSSTDVSEYNEATLEIFFYENQTSENQWVELPLEQRSHDQFGFFVKTSAPRTLDPTKLTSEYFCLGGARK